MMGIAPSGDNERMPIRMGGEIRKSRKHLELRAQLPNSVRD
jgi:hypothetical protein